MATNTYHDRIRSNFDRHIILNGLFTDQYGITKTDVETATDDYDDNNIECLVVPNTAYLYLLTSEQVDDEGFGEASNETLIYDGILTDKYLVIVYI
jgi:hypothetical protein